VSRIDELIAELCPDGVEHMTLGDVAQYAKSRTSSEDITESNYVGVENLLQNTAGRVDSSAVPSHSALIEYRVGDVLIGNIRPYLRKAWLADRAGGTNGDVLVVRIRPAYRESILARFLYYLLSSDAFFAYDMQHAKGAKMPRGDKAAILRYGIPVPPLEVQREIVRVLDAFTELEAELEARRRQYAYYRDALLTFPEGGVRWVPMAELLREPLANGRSVPDGSGYPVLRLTALHGPVVDATQHKLGAWDQEEGSRFRIEAGDLLVVRGNGSKDLIARACMVERREEVAFADTMIRVRPNLERVSQRYLFHIWESRATRSRIARTAKRTSGVWKVSQDDIARVELPVPSVEEQARIVAILDNFDALVNDLSSGLPAELVARRKQYEHYRDRLMTFKVAAA